MCVVSMVTEDALGWPRKRWLDPDWRLHWNDIYSKAREYDRRTGQPDCPDTEKKRQLQDLADKLGVEINFE